MIRENKTLKYEQNMNGAQFLKIMKAVGLPTFVFGFGMFAISSLGNFGSIMICPLAGFMWMLGLLTAFLIPQMRGKIIDETLMHISIYYAIMLTSKLLISLASGVSAEQIAASFNQGIPTATGNTLPGYLTSLMLITGALYPLNFLRMEGSRLMQFRRTSNIHTTFGRLRSVRGANQEHLQND